MMILDIFLKIVVISLNEKFSNGPTLINTP